MDKDALKKLLDEDKHDVAGMERKLNLASDWLKATDEKTKGDIAHRIILEAIKDVGEKYNIKEDDSAYLAILNHIIHMKERIDGVREGMKHLTGII